MHLKDIRTSIGYNIFFAKKYSWILPLIDSGVHLLPKQLASSMFGSLVDPFSPEERNQGFIFIHIPKTAGKSVMNALTGKDAVGHYPATKYRDFNPELFARCIKFTIVRNPWDRLVSAYSYLKQGGIGKYDQEFARRHLSGEENFGEFVTRLCEAAPSSELRNWTHFKPQSEFILDEGGNILIDFIGRFENLDADFQELKRKLGFPESILEISNISRHQHYTNYYHSESLIDSVASIYEKDIELLNYEFDRQ